MMASSGKQGSLIHDSSYYESKIGELSMQLSRVQIIHSNCDHDKDRLNQ